MSLSCTGRQNGENAILLLHSLKARTAEALEQAIAQALPSITPDNARAWFRHCGINYIP